MKRPDAETAEFDDYAANYDSALAEGLSVSGESKDFFAEGRIKWLKARLGQMGIAPKSVMDFGCGTGSATAYLLDILSAERVVGLDVSPKSLEIARRDYRERSAIFEIVEDYRTLADIDVVYCNGTFHHIPPVERALALDVIIKSLRPGGVFAFWENNPWNPGTQYVMWRCPFDKTAVKVSPPAARRLLKNSGFEVLKTDFQFIFPRFLNTLRRFEPGLANLPLGAQYQVLCKKPDDG